MREYFPTICGTTGTNGSLQSTIRCLIYLFSLVYPFRSILFMCAILRMRTRVPACNIIMCISFTVSSLTAPYIFKVLLLTSNNFLFALSEYVIKPCFNTFDTPGTFTKRPDNNPPVQDSAVAIVFCFLIKIYSIT